MTISICDQVLTTLMKLRLNLRDLDLAERFGVSDTTFSKSYLFQGVLVTCVIPSQLKRGRSPPASFKDFVSARLVIDATESTKDVPSEFGRQAACYSSYKSRHTAKAVTGVTPVVHGEFPDSRDTRFIWQCFAVSTVSGEFE